MVTWLCEVDDRGFTSSWRIPLSGEAQIKSSQLQGADPISSLRTVKMLYQHLH